MRANLAAALTEGDFGGAFVELKVCKRGSAAGIATALEEFSVHVEDISRSRQFVKIVNVLGAQEEPILQSVFEFRKRDVG